MRHQHQRKPGRPPSTPSAYKGIKHAQRTHPRLDYEDDGTPVVTVRSTAEVSRMVVDLFDEGVSPPRITVRLQVPLAKVLGMLRTNGRDVSAYDLSGVEAYGFGGAS